jgi:radical SAM superfamily enzyme YgiQ (UPF0313 family)
MGRPILLVSLDWMRVDERRSLGAASIVAALRAVDAEVDWMDAAVNDDAFSGPAFVDEVLRRAEAMGPGVLVGIGCYVWNNATVDALLAALRDTRVDVVLGGPQISYTKTNDLAGRYPGVRYFVRGYGEEAMVDLALGEEQNGVHGLFDAREVDLGRRSTGALENLPSPYLEGTLEIGRTVRWETQRGCPFRCSFCQHRDPHRRYRPQVLCEDRIGRELQVFVEAGVERISILDPIFHTDTARAVRILAQARELGVRAKLSLQCRFEMINDVFLDALNGLDVTLEFGLQTVHDAESKAIKRRNNMRVVEEKLALVRERGIDFEISLIFGLPNQTLASFQASVRWCLDQQVPRVRAWPLMLLRGTPLYEQKNVWGFHESGGSIPEVVASDTMSHADNDWMREIATLLNRDAPEHQIRGMLHPIV